ncbi:Hexaprenyldihydroxybenzoate methyltransferase, mitochondrial [Gryganskiella cystojenkinii]|nr:Hexaprenyldihydroxybenzoate methyltransferase, mitochondrial [Gryganskiella cystojenkinii]
MATLLRRTTLASVKTAASRIYCAHPTTHAALTPVRHLAISSTRLHSNHSSEKSSPTTVSGSSVFTVNEDEIAKFAAMSDEWWAPQGPFKMLHLMNPPRIRYIRNRLLASGTALGENAAPTTGDSRARFPLQGLRILDVGCGGGLLAEALARLGATVTGLDASIENIQMARIHAKKDPLFNGGGSPGSLEYRHQTAEQLLEQGQQFDVVCSMEVIEHVDNPAGFLRVLGQLVKPNGDLILSTISRTPLAYLLTVFSAEHLLRMVPVGTHHWSKYITPEELTKGVEDLAQCKVLNVQGIGFNPLSGQWELTKSRSSSSEDTDSGLLSLLGSSFAESVNYFLAAKKTGPPSP